MKLRKHLRTKRLEGVRQCGFDRILQLTFATGDHTNHVFIELHSGGNIILADATLKIMSLLRPYETAQAGKVAVHERYPIEHAIELNESCSVNVDESQSLMSFCIGQGLPKQLVSYCLAELGFDKNTKATPENVALVYEKCNHIVAGLRALDTPTKGYLFKKDAKNVEFSPILFQEHQLYSESETFPTFNEAMDAFFSTLESIQKVQQSAKNEWKALSKEEKMRRDLDQRINKLEAVSDRNSQLAALIEDNLDLIDSIINALRTEIASGASWTELERMVAEETQHGQNPIASSIKSLHFEKNSVVVFLGPGKTPVEIDLGISAHASANNYYNAKKKAKNKSERTIAASEVAMKSAKTQAQKDLKKAQKKGTVGAQALSVRRRTHWFEKFQWFITSDNFLVIGGRDAQQNELVVRRHLDPNDLYFHADMHGASSVILKNPEGVGSVPERSLQEAAQFTVCNSAAWTNKAIGSAYWVKADQVSKTAPTGMYVSTGSFMVRGKRNYIPCSQLLLGLNAQQDCIAAHKSERSAHHDEDEFSNPGKIDRIISDNEDDDLGIQDLSLKASNFEQNSGDGFNTNRAAMDNGDGQSDDQESDADPSDPAPEIVEQPDASTELKPSAASFDVTSSLLHSLSTDDSPSYNPNLFKKLDDGQSGGGRLSVKQRRQMKKSGKSANETIQDQNQPEEKPKPASAPILPRGKRNKLKKMKKKYADQDEVDRQRALQLLGSSSIKELDGADEKSPSSEEESDNDEAPVADQTDQEPVQDQDWIVKICFHCHSQGHVARTCPQLDGLDKTTVNKIVQQGQDRNREENQKHTKDDGDEDFNLHCLVGCPTTSDELLYALPMCAPYSAIMNYKFKVKVIPGVDKRGTAAKSCLSLCMRMLQGDPDANRIQNLMKAISDNDLAVVLPPGSKVSAPGIGSIKNSKHSKKPGQKRPKK